jgi:hypothetical protein
METTVFPRCCALNILSGFPADTSISLDELLAQIPQKIKDHETGVYGVGYCALSGYSPYIRAHVLAVSGKQLKAKAKLETLGYRLLGSCLSAHSSKDPYSLGYYRIYLMGKGFDLPGMEPK